MPGSQPVRRGPLGTPRALSAVVAALGLINLIAGFLPEVALPASGRQVVQSVSVFAVGPGWVPLLLLTGGLLAAAAFLPGGGDHRFAAAAVSVAGAVGAVVALGVPNGFEQLLGASLGNGAGALLLFIGGTIQAVVAVAALVLAIPGPTAGVFHGGSAAPGSAAAPTGPWPGSASPSGGDGTGFGPGPASAPSWPGAAGFGAAPPAGPADDQRVTGPIPVVRPDSGPTPPVGDRAGRHWARPDDATVTTRSPERPSGGATPDAR